MATGIKVFAPATLSNLCVGFDSLGVALEHYGDEIIATPNNSDDLRITEIINDKNLPRDPSLNTATVAIEALFQHLGRRMGMDLRIKKNMPISSGMGSSAASAVAAVLAANELLGRAMEQRALLPFAYAGEKINGDDLPLDNVAPSLLGGMVLIRSNEDIDVHRLILPPGIYFAVIKANISIDTKESRRLLPSSISLEQHIKQAAHFASFIHALSVSNLNLMRSSFKDLIVQPSRKETIPNFQEMHDIAMEKGAMGFGISGSGPTLFALCDNRLCAENIIIAAQTIYGEDALCFVSKVNQEGGKLC